MNNPYLLQRFKMSSSFAPRKIKKFSKLIIIANSTITITKIERIKESVKKELAFFSSPRERYFLYKVEPPTPKRSPKEKITVQKGVSTAKEAVPSSPWY